MNPAMIVDVVVVLIIFRFFAYQQFWLYRYGHTLPNLDHLPEPEMADIYLKARPKWTMKSLITLVVIGIGLWRFYEVLWLLEAGGAGAWILLIMLGSISSYHTISYYGVISLVQAAKKDGLLND